MSRILLVRLDGLGDALVMTPLIAALRAAGHELGALLTSRNAGAFAPAALAFTHVVERIPWPKHGLEPAGEGRALAAVRAIGYDLALIASEEPDAYRFAKEAAIARRVGFVNGWEKPLKSVWTRRLLSDAIVRPASASRETQHEVERLFALGTGLHGETQPTADVRRLRPLVIAAPREPHGAVVIQTSPKLSAQGLTAGVVSEIALSVARDHRVVLCEGPAGAAFALDVHARTGLALTQPDVERWKQLIDGAAAIVTPDSGAAHVAGMVGTPCVDLFAGGPNVRADMRRWRPWASAGETIAVERSNAAELPARIRAAIDRLAAVQAR